MRGLTDAQRKVLFLIAQRHRDNGVPPTHREIGAAMGIASTNGVNDHVNALIRKGFLEKAGTNKSRALRVIRLPEDAPESLCARNPDVCPHCGFLLRRAVRS